MPSALEGMKIVELGHVISVPFATALLADFGAQVVKIEVPGVGDGLRTMSKIKNMFFAVEGRNKKCITLNLQKEKGKEIFKKLLVDADVLIENYRPGTLAKLGFDWETLHQINPKLSLVSVSGYGQTGPYRDRPGYDSVGMAMGGLTYVSGSPDGPPVRPGLALGDYITGLFAALGAMFAVYARDKQPAHTGQIVDISLYESVFRLMETAAIEYSYNGTIKERVGNGHPVTVPSGHFQTKDGKWVVVTSGNNKIFANLCRAMKKNDWLEDPKFQSQTDRIKNRKQLDEGTAGFIKQQTLEELKESFGEDVPLAVIYNIEDIFNDPHYASRNNLVELATDNFGKIKMQGIVPKMSATPGEVKWAGVGEMGYHNQDVYQGLGFSKEDIDQLKRDEVI